MAIQKVWDEELQEWMYDDSEISDDVGFDV